MFLWRNLTPFTWAALAATLARRLPVRGAARNAPTAKGGAKPPADPKSRR